MSLFKHLLEPVTTEKAKAAARVLGLELSGLTEEAVFSAFRKHAKEVHPDTGGSSMGAAERLKLISDARGSLISWIEELPDDECMCKGTGYVKTGGMFGSVKPCPNCSPIPSRRKER